MLELIPFKVRKWIYNNRITLDVIVLVLFQSIIFRLNLSEIITEYTSKITGGEVIMTSVTSLIPPLILFLISRLVIKDYKFYPSGGWKYFNGVLLSTIISSLMILITLDHQFDGKIMSVNIIIVSIISSILSGFKIIYNTRWE